MIRTARAFALALAVMAAPAMAFDLSAMSDDDRAAFGDAVRSYLMDNPEVIVEALNELEARQQAEQALADLQLVQTHAQEIFDDGYSWIGGNPDGDITIVEFLDYRCGFCRRAHPELESVLAADGNIRLIVKEFPILGEASLTASRFAIAVKQIAGGDAYKAVHDALIAMAAEPTEVSLRRLTEGLGLDADAILERMDDDSVSQEILRTRVLAQNLQIRGTPTFVMEDELVRGFLPADQMAALLAGKRG